MYFTTNAVQFVVAPKYSSLRPMQFERMLDEAGNREIRKFYEMLCHRFWVSKKAVNMRGLWIVLLISGVQAPDDNSCDTSENHKKGNICDIVWDNGQFS